MGLGEWRVAGDCRSAGESRQIWSAFATPLRPLGKMARSGAFRGFRQIRRNKGGIRYLGASKPRENYRF